MTSSIVRAQLYAHKCVLDARAPRWRTVVAMSSRWSVSSLIRRQSSTTVSFDVVFSLCVVRCSLLLRLQGRAKRDDVDRRIVDIIIEQQEAERDRRHRDSVSRHARSA
jgi:hypothetical protein